MFTYFARQRYTEYETIRKIVGSFDEHKILPIENRILQ